MVPFVVIDVLRLKKWNTCIMSIYSMSSESIMGVLHADTKIEYSACTATKGNTVILKNPNETGSIFRI